jgi:hypothetical protein
MRESRIVGLQTQGRNSGSEFAIALNGYVHSGRDLSGEFE